MYLLLPLLLFVLADAGYQVAHRNGSSGFVGALVGSIAWLAAGSGYMIALMIKDYFAKAIQPQRKGVSATASILIFVVFFATSGTTAWWLNSVLHH